MEKTELRKYIENDNFLDIAYERYEKFKLTDDYDEQYKFDTLSKLNEYFAGRTIDENNVVEIARKLFKINNELKWKLVYWDYPKDFVEFAAKYPDKTARLLKSLYKEHDRELEERINEFHKED